MTTSGTGTARSPSSAAAVFRRSSPRASSTTLAPSSRARAAVALPMPAEAPETTTTLPSRLPVISEDAAALLVGDDLVPVEPQLEEDLLGVLACVRRPTLGAGGLAVELHRRAHQPQRSLLGVDRGQVAVGFDLHMVVVLCLGQGGRPDPAERVHGVVPVVDGAGGHSCVGL